MFNIVFLIVGLCVALKPLYAANELKSYQKVLLFYEIGFGQCNPYCWNNMHDLQTIAALSQVDKELYHCINTPREAVMQRHPKYFDFIKCSILFNKYGQWCGLGTRKDKFYFLFGDQSVFWGKSVESGGISKFKYRIENFEIELYTDNQIPKKCSAFHVRTYGDNFLGGLIIPDNLSEKSPRYEIWVPVIKDICTNNKKKLFKVSSLKKSAQSIIQSLCALSKNNSFMDDTFMYDSAVKVEREIGEVPNFVNITINFEPQSLFNFDNVKKLCAPWKPHNQCGCTTEFIDKACLQDHRELCAAADHEGIAHIKTGLTEHFAQHHILHEIQTVSHITDIISKTVRLFSNPYGCVIAKCTSNQSRTNLLPLLPLENEITWLRKQAELHANQWEMVGNYMYTLRNPKDDPNSEKYAQLNIIRLQGLNRVPVDWDHVYCSPGDIDWYIIRPFAFLIDKSYQQQIIDNCKIRYKDGHHINFIDIFMLKKTDLSMGLLIMATRKPKNFPVEVQVHAYKTIQQIKDFFKNFKDFAHKNALLVEAPAQEVNNMMAYFKKGDFTDLESSAPMPNPDNALESKPAGDYMPSTPKKNFLIATLSRLLPNSKNPDQKKPFIGTNLVYGSTTFCLLNLLQFLPDMPRISVATSTLLSAATITSNWCAHKPLTTVALYKAGLTGALLGLSYLLKANVYITLGFTLYSSLLDYHWNKEDC